MKIHETLANHRILMLVGMRVVVQECEINADEQKASPRFAAICGGCHAPDGRQSHKQQQ